MINSRSALGGRFVVHPSCTRSSQKKSTFCHKALSSPSLWSSYQQTLSRMQNCRFPKISLETRIIKSRLCCISPAISSLFPFRGHFNLHNGKNLSMIKRTWINDKCKISNWHLTLHNGRKLIKLPAGSNSSCSFIILANLEYNTHEIHMHYAYNTI